MSAAAKGPPQLQSAAPRLQTTQRAAVGRKRRPHSAQACGFALLLPSSHAVANSVSVAVHPRRASS
eukprot:8305549-Alexandrium_andersonii.AAC.1